MTRINTITPQEAAMRMRRAGLHISPSSIRQGIEQRVYPFGDYVLTANGGKRYWIYESLFQRWLEERSTEGE